MGTSTRRYRFEKVLGHGAFATVYLAKRTPDDLQFAVKVLADNLSQDPEVRKRFTAEADILRSIEGPGVVTVHDVGETQSGQPFIALDYADLGNLQTYLDAHRGAINGEASGRLLVATARALARAHARLVAHRDLKPANILLKSQAGNPSADHADHELLVADFGVARALLEATKQTTRVVGTPAYMAPEQFENRGDRRSDVYALGVLAYQLLTGYLPFPQQSWEEQYSAKKRELYIPLDRRLREFEGRPATAIHESLSAEPSKRPTDADAWLASLVERIGTTTPIQPLPGPGYATITNTPGPGGGVGNVNHGILARSLGPDRLRALRRLASERMLTSEEWRLARMRLLSELGFTKDEPLASPSGTYAQAASQDLMRQYRQLVDEGALTLLEFETVRHSLLRQSGIL